MEVFSTLTWDGISDIRLYLDCISSQKKVCGESGLDYFVLCNENAENSLARLGIKTRLIKDLLSEEFMSKLEPLFESKSYACISDILRIMTLDSIGAGLHLDGDIYMKSSPLKFLDLMKEGDFLIGVENGGWLCTGVIGQKGHHSVVKNAASYLKELDVLENWWQVYGNRLLSRMIDGSKEESSSIKFLNPSLLLGVNYEVLKLIRSVDLEEYYKSNPSAIGLHMCGASLDFEEKNVHGEKLSSTLYDSGYYQEEYSGVSNLMDYSENKMKIYKHVSPKFKYSKKVRL